MSNYPSPPAKLQNEKLYAKLYYAYLRACASNGPQSQPSGPLIATPVRLEKKFEKRPAQSNVHACAPRVCRHCQDVFPSGNALHVHLRNLKRERLPTPIVPGHKNILNDPNCTDDPFVVIRNAENKLSTPALLTQIKEGQNESGLLPAGFLDSFFDGSLSNSIEILDPPPPEFNSVYGDGKPKAKRNKYYLEADNNALAANDFVDYSRAMRFSHSSPEEPLTIDSVLDQFRTSLPGNSLPNTHILHQQITSTLNEELHNPTTNTSSTSPPITTSRTYASVVQGDSIPIQKSEQSVDTQSRRTNDLFDSDEGDESEGEHSDDGELTLKEREEIAAFYNQ